MRIEVFYFDLSFLNPSFETSDKMDCKAKRLRWLLFYKNHVTSCRLSEEGEFPDPGSTLISVKSQEMLIKIEHTRECSGTTKGLSSQLDQRSNEKISMQAGRA